MILAKIEHSDYISPIPVPQVRLNHMNFGKHLRWGIYWPDYVLVACLYQMVATLLMHNQPPWNLCTCNTKDQYHCLTHTFTTCTHDTTLV